MEEVDIAKELEVKANSKAKSKSIILGLVGVLTKEIKNGCNPVTPALLNDILIAKKIKKSKLANADILKEILFYQCCFYLLNDKQSDSLLKVYGYLYRHPSESYEYVISGLVEVLEPITIPMVVHLSKSHVASLEDLKAFTDAAKVSIGVYYKLIEDAIRDVGGGIAPLWVYHAEVIGNERVWKKKLTHWLRCYFAYELKKEGMGQTEIGRSLQDLDLYAPLNLKQRDKYNLVHKVDELLNEAERLMLSTKNGTFPI